MYRTTAMITTIFMFLYGQLLMFLATSHAVRLTVFDISGDFTFWLDLSQANSQSESQVQKYGLSTYIDRTFGLYFLA